MQTISPANSLVAFEPFSPLIINKLSKIGQAKERQELMQEIFDDKYFVRENFSNGLKGITKTHPLHIKGKGWKQEEKIAMNLNKAGFDVAFLPEMKDQVSADALIRFNGKWIITDFKSISSTSSSNIATALKEGFLQASHLTVQLYKADIGIFREAIEEMKRKRMIIGDITLMNKYGKIVEIERKHLISGKYEKIIKGKLCKTYPFIPQQAF